jgi:hypothetical protein
VAGSGLNVVLAADIPDFDIPEMQTNAGRLNTIDTKLSGDKGEGE